MDPPEFWISDLPCVPLEPPLPHYNLDENVIVDLVDPLYEEGVLSTESGGVLTATGLRIQAQKITYVRNLEADPPVFTVICSGNLLVDYREWTLVGDTFFYDFVTQSGSLTQGKTASPPWYIGGREILMEEDELIILDGFITTSEGEIEDVVVRSPKISITPDRILTASYITLRLNDTPIFWLPSFELDMKNIGRSPLAVKFGWGGFLGSNLSLLYRFPSWGDFEITARLDAFFGKGMGGGIETAYDPPSRPTLFFTRNYYAHDIALDDRHRRDRYRFQGTYWDRFYDITVDGMYDFVSDAQMAAEYRTKDFELKTAGRTELEVRQERPFWIANFFTRVRVNDFQSVNQELPSFQLNWHPFEIPSTGIICENIFKASYLNFVFSRDVQPRRNLSSSRIAIHPFVYRPFLVGPLTATPEAGFIGIAYSDSPRGRSAGQALGELGFKLETTLSKNCTSWKHTLEPYLHYQFLTTPSVPTEHHFIFSIQDGWDKLNLLRFGVRNSFFLKSLAGIVRPFWVDLWANAFFNTLTIPQTIPKGYLDVEWIPTPRTFCSLKSGWNFQERQLDFINARIDWTLNENNALGIEYRHRSRFDWRKADFYNFILESVRTQKELLDSTLSDRRDTFLFRIFSRLTPDWTARFNLRHGWNRKGKQGSFTEYQIEMTRVVFQHWRLIFGYEKREDDHRFSFSFLLDPGPPPRSKCI